MYVPKRAVDKGWEAEGAETYLGFQSSDVLLKVSGMSFMKSSRIFWSIAHFLSWGSFFVAESCGLFVGWVPQILDNIFKVKNIELVLTNASSEYII